VQMLAALRNELKILQPVSPFNSEYEVFCYDHLFMLMLVFLWTFVV